MLQGTILAFDFGLRRVGVAVGQTVTRSASPLATLENRDPATLMARIRAFIDEWQPERLVVGMPFGAGGEDSDMTEPVRAFIVELGGFGLPVDTVDERHTSKEARAALTRARQAGARRRIKKADIDSAAAVLIAERWLELAPGSGP